MDPEVPADVYERMVLLRRELHRYPELSWQEHETAARVAGALSALGITYRTGVAGTGIVADLPGVGDGPRVALRADFDALPIHEETGLDYASRTPGVMHACGHDGHASMLVGAAELLARDPPPRPVRLIWQPAEELAAGAKRMIEEGVLDGVGSIFGGHVDRHHLPGTLVVTEGGVNASADLFEIALSGRQGHGARPHEALDAVVAGSLLVTALQTIVSREVDPAHPSVLTVGTFHAGTAHNVIAGRAELTGTIRTRDRATRAHLHAALERIARSIGQLHGAEVSVRIEAGTPSLHNLPAPTGVARRAAVEVVGEPRVEELRTTNMGGEDFAYFLDHVPGCYVRFGAQVAGAESHPAHSSGFQFHEQALATGAAWFDRVARIAGSEDLSAPP